MKRLISALAMLLFCLDAGANSNFAGNPYLPYPPGCAQTPGSEPAWLQANAVRFYNGEIQLWDVQTGDRIPFGLSIYRSRCSEPNRSLIWLEFSLADTLANRNVEVSLPDVWRRQGDWVEPMQLTAEPGGWQAGSIWEADGAQSYLVMKPQNANAGDGGADVPAGGVRRWLFVLDNITSFGFWGKYYPVMTADEYNGSFKLQLQVYPTLEIDIPATETLLPEAEPFIPLSGRLSGVWVVEGAADQGFSLAVSEFVPVVETDSINRGNPELLIFLTQYTFDAEGGPLWLSGAARFTPGASEVSIPLERVTGGEFRGGKPAVRETVGNVTLTAKSCDDLEFSFDYSTLGLGSGTRRLQRPFSLETAGYECRDYAARVAANR